MWLPLWRRPRWRRGRAGVGRVPSRDADSVGCLARGHRGGILTGYLWTMSQADELGLDRDRVAIYGASAGGGLALGMTLLARDRGAPQPCFQMAPCPMIDPRNDTPSSHEITDLGTWDRSTNVKAWRWYLGGREPDAYGRCSAGIHRSRGSSCGPAVGRGAHRAGASCTGCSPGWSGRSSIGCSPPTGLRLGAPSATPRGGGCALTANPTRCASGHRCSRPRGCHRRSGRSDSTSRRPSGR